MANIKTLLVDDELEFLDVLRKRLALRNVDVVAVDSGEKAVQAVKDSEFDVIILDVKMPGMNGLEALRQIKLIVPDVEVIILSGHADLQFVDQGLELGAFDYLIKPVAISDLLAKITDAHRKRHKTL